MQSEGWCVFAHFAVGRSVEGPGVLLPPTTVVALDVLVRDKVSATQAAPGAGWGWVEEEGVSGNVLVGGRPGSPGQLVMLWGIQREVGAEKVWRLRVVVEGASVGGGAGGSDGGEGGQQAC